MRRIILSLTAVAIIALVSVTDVSASVFKSGRLLKIDGRRVAAVKKVANKCEYPKVKQIDGRTLWDLGKTNGSWPEMP